MILDQNQYLDRYQKSPQTPSLEIFPQFTELFLGEDVCCDCKIRFVLYVFQAKIWQAARSFHVVNYIVTKFFWVQFKLSDFSCDIDYVKESEHDE